MTIVSRSDGSLSQANNQRPSVETVTGIAPPPTRDARTPEPCDDAFSVIDTTELRWFVPGPLPADTCRWFTGATGVPEVRCDTYLIDGDGDIGVKRRSR